MSSIYYYITKLLKLYKYSMITGIIYRHTNKVNGKAYIGQTIKSMEERFKCHIKSAENGDSYEFQRAIRKYGVESFYSEILEADIELLSIIQERDNILNIKEKYWIAFYDTFKNGYNMTLGGGGMCGHVKSQETLDKMKNTIHSITPEEKQKISENVSKRLKLFYSVNKHHTKGKSYEEIMGVDKAIELKKIRSINNPMNNLEFREKARLNRIDSIKNNPMPSGKNSKLYGIEKSDEHKDALKKAFKKCGHSQGSKNSQARSWKLTYHEQEYFITGILQEFCRIHEISDATLKQNLGSIVPEPSRNCSARRQNTTGWILERL